MPDYLIEIPHSPEECSIAPVEADTRGLALRAYRGCGDGTHTTWIVAELAEAEAWSLVPALLRDTARVIAIEPWLCGPDGSLEPASTRKDPK
jgi:hypothetical protein